MSVFFQHRKEAVKRKRNDSAWAVEFGCKYEPQIFPSSNNLCRLPKFGVTFFVDLDVCVHTAAQGHEVTSILNPLTLARVGRITHKLNRVCALSRR